MKRILFALSALALSTNAFAFPEMVRYGYTNCITCHVSPAGGGLLTPYGRQISAELLSHGKFFFEKGSSEPESTKDESKEQDFLYGLVPLPSWLNLGGDTRVLQYFQDNAYVEQAKFLLMQADLEAAATYNRVQLVAWGGIQYLPTYNSFGDYFISRDHWASLLLGPQADLNRFQIRLGRFFPAYGLNIAEHTVITRQGLGFDQDDETYNFEASWIDDNINLYLTSIFGRPDNPSLEQGLSFQAAVPVAETYKVGANVYTGLAPGAPINTRRYLAGTFAMLGFTQSIYALAEVDGMYSQLNSSGLTDYVKLGDEVVQGLHFFVTQEFQRRTYLDPTQTYEAYGVGIQYFPRPHWDFLGTAEMQRDFAVSPLFGAALWAIVHYYL